MKNIFLLILVSIILSACTQKNPMKVDTLKFEVSQIDSQKFFEKQKNKNDNVTQVFENDKKEILRLYINANYDLEKAKKTIVTKSNEIKMLFAPQQAPYFGQITKEIKCTEAVDLKNELIENDKEVSLVLNLTATERFIYGSCIADQEIYKSQLLFLYCKKSSTLHEIRYFYDIKLAAYKTQIAHCE